MSLPSMPQMPQAPSLPQANPAQLPSQLPGGLGESAKQVSDLGNKMQGMQCPDFNPGMPGANLASQMSDHLTKLNNAAQNLQNPTAKEMAAAQAAAQKAQQNPTVQNIQNSQQATQALQTKVTQVYGDPQQVQKAAQFASNAQARANSEQTIAQQRAVAKTQQVSQHYSAKAQQAQQQANDYQQKANDSQQKAQTAAGNKQTQAAQDYQNQSQQYQQQANHYQQKANDYQQKAQTAQNAASNMQNQLPQAPSINPSQYPTNPYSNLTASVQNVQLPNCPQLGALQSQLSNVQQAWQDVMSGAAAAAALLAALALINQEPQEESEPPSKDSLVINGGEISCSMAVGGPGSVIVVPSGTEVNGQGPAQPSTVQFAYPCNCSSLSNPNTAQLTAAAQGVLTPGPCLLSAGGAIPFAWTPTTAGTQEVNGQPCLVQSSTGKCIYGGDLTFADPGHPGIAEVKVKAP